MAGRISPLFGRGNEYSWKVPFAIIDDVVLGCEWTVGESIGPTFDGVDLNESPQAEIRNVRRSTIGKITKCFDFINMRPVIVFWLITNLLLYNTFQGYILLNHNAEYSIINQFFQMYCDNGVLPILVC
jgi:hypothetical protein